MNAAELKTRTAKDLATLAKKKKVLGWHAMRKEELISALVKVAKTEARRRAAMMKSVPAPATAAKVAKTNGHANGQSNGHAKNGATNGCANGKVLPEKAKNGAVGGNGKNGSLNGGVNGNSTVNGNGSANGNGKHVAANESACGEKPPAIETIVAKRRSPQVERRLQQIKTRLHEAKDLSFRTIDGDNVHSKDRLVVMVRDPYWLHAYWELSRRSIQRAQAAMGQHWHAAHPVLRLLEVSRNGTTSAARKTIRDIEIHGGVNNWYVDVQNPPKSYQLEVGYLEPGGRFFCLARSNVVSTPAPGSSDTFDRNWSEVAKEFDRIYAMTASSTEQEANGDLKDVFEEHLHRPMGESLTSQFGPGASVHRRDFQFQVSTELIVHGVTHPDARVTLRGEPVRLRPDGTFAVRFSLPDRRHVLPVVANSCDGAEQRTIVLAIDRNTKVMEPVLRDPGE